MPLTRRYSKGELGGTATLVVGPDRELRRHFVAGRDEHQLRRRPDPLGLLDHVRGDVLDDDQRRRGNPPRLRVRSGGGRRERHRRPRRAACDGTTFAVEWIEIDHADPDAESRPGPGVAANRVAANRVAVRYQAQAKGAATFYRGEGIAYGSDLFYFVATQAGPPAPENLPSPPASGRGNGQVWAYDPRAEELTLVVEAAASGELLDEPDNVVVTPFGDLFLCEDSSDATQHIVGVTEAGELYPFARNILFEGSPDPATADFIGNEFAGACFSPDGRTLFVNIQTPGMTFAIWGPWPRRRT